MKYLSVCAGIEAASVAWHDLGWQPVGFSEIEPFPSKVLEHHYPHVENYGDMTKYKEWNIEKPDLIVGGTPCQSFSVAGLRKGLDDPRGNLALVYCGMLDHFRPNWFVWENVPGVLSSNKGRDFGAFLGAVAELGYGFSYRVLDAQYFGVAQRRRRVFVVGHLGDWRPAAAVLFERESLRRDTPPSRESRKEVAGTITSRTGVSYSNPEEVVCHSIALAENTIGRQPMNGGNGNGFTENGPMYTLNATGVHGVAQVYENHPTDSRIKPLDETCSTVTARWGTGGGNTPLVAEPDVRTYNPDQPQCYRVYDPDGLAPSLQAGESRGNAIICDAIPLNTMTMQGRPSDDGRMGLGIGKEGDPCPTLTKAHSHAVAYSFDSLGSNSMKSKNPNSGCRPVELSKTLDTTIPEPSKNQGGIAIVESNSVPNPDNEIVGSLCARDSKGVGSQYVDEGKVIPCTPQPVPFKETADCLTAAYGTKWNGNASATNGSLFALHPVGVDVYNQTVGGDVDATLTETCGGTNTSGPKVMEPIPYDLHQVTSPHNRQSRKEGDPCHTLLRQSAQSAGIVFSDDSEGGTQTISETSGTLRANSSSDFKSDGSSVEGVAIQNMAVRRLTPVECERLQGFPDNYTRIEWRNKPLEQCPDSHRYKALGNSMAVPVMRWIGENIQEVEAVQALVNNGDIDPEKAHEKFATSFQNIFE